MFSKKTTSILAFTGILAIGIGIGFFSSVHFYKHKMKHRQHHKPRLPKPEKLLKRLDLGENQKQPVRELLAGFRLQADMEARKFKKQVRQLRDSLDARMEPLLTPEQLQRYRKLRKRMFKPRKLLRKKGDRSRQEALGVRR